jgi:phosphoglycolate phosphatase
MFDFDGTLADTWRDIATALNRTLREAGLDDVPGERVRSWIGNGVVQLLERTVPAAEQSPEHIAALYGRFRVHYDDCCLATTTLYPGIAQCLSDLSGHTLAVLSNKPTHFLERMIAGLRLQDRFAAVVGGDVLPVRKPDRAAVDYAVRAAGVVPSELWMIGDSAIDVATGRAAGAHTIGCTWGFRSRAELITAGAGFLVDHPQEIPPLINPGGL